MSDRSVLDDFLKRKESQNRAATLADAPQAETGDADEVDYRAFGINRSKRQALMLDVRTLTKGRLGFSYSYLENVFFDESGFLVLSLGSYKVMIHGRILAPLYEGLLNHSVRFIQQENPELEPDVPSDETFISEIEIIEK